VHEAFGEELPEEVQRCCVQEAFVAMQQGIQPAAL